MSAPSPRRRLWAAGLSALALSAAMAGEADAARRGGSFGSRGSRTYSQPGGGFGGGPFAAPISRSVTPNRPGSQPGGFQPGGGFNRPFGGPQSQGGRRSWVGPMLGGLAAGGLLGMMMGGGFGGGLGGGAGAFGGILQMLLLAGAAFLLFRLFQAFRRRREEQAPAGVPSRFDAGRPGLQNGPPSGFGNSGGGGLFGGFGQPQGQGQQGFGQGFGQAQGSGGQGGDELGLGRGEVQALERTFAEVQAAYGREDYAGIRERCTPEVMSFMSEELARNATEGRKNEMRDFRILHSELTESWREETGDYATLTVRFSSLDWWVDRSTGAVVEGDPAAVVEATEFWTFNRQPGAFGAGGWKVSAIQEQGR